MSAKIVLLLAAAVAVASASEYLQELKAKERSVQELNDWLSQNFGDSLPENREPEKNLLEAQKAVEAHPSFKSAVEALQTIATASNNCDQSVREALRLFLSLDRNRRMRLERVVNQLGSKLPTVHCMLQMEKDFEAQAHFDDPKTNALARYHFKVNSDIYLFGGKLRFNHFLSHASDQKVDELVIEDLQKFISVDVKELAKEDPKALIHEGGWVERDGFRVRDDKFYPENYKYAFETYLQKPCQQYTAKMEKLFEGFFGVSHYVTNPTKLRAFKDQVEYRPVGTKYETTKVPIFQYMIHFLSEEFRNGLLTYKKCRIVESLDEESVKRAFNTAHLRNYATGHD